MLLTSRWLMLLLALFCSGCGRGGTAKAVAIEQSNLRQLAIMHGQFVREHRGKLPENEADFKQFVAYRGKRMLEKLDLDVESLFVSPRDGQPYVIFYQGNPPPKGSGLAGYEQEGTGGIRLVASDIGSVQEADESRFYTLVGVGN